MRRERERLVGHSPAAKRLEFSIGRAAAFDCSVLILGETGSGKEEVARAIHAAGIRRDKPFVAVNCGALTSTLAESQLFGHVKGSFTGAVGASAGVFRAAQGGVVFLDEIGELPLDLQPKLLRVLQQREVTPVGSTDVVHVDIQVLAATNRDLSAEVEKAAFREDLFYRLNTIELVVPPLRERAEDIAMFVTHFSKKFAERHGRLPWFPDAATLGKIVRHPWPGNVRELVQFIERVYVLDAVPVIASESPAGDGPRNDVAPASPPAKKHRPHAAIPAATSDPAEPLLPVFNLEQLRRMAVRQALTATGGHKGKAAALLGVHLNTMTRFAAEALEEAGPSTAGMVSRKPR